ncbi:MAG: ribosome-associated translation inhibitor RaiA [Armatimonadetes bacterium]|nr:ribosome-associated translation inhibitor RaiA [Armatimonadota bacterium]
MRIDFHGHNAEVTQRLRDHAEPRLQALARHFQQVQSVKIVVKGQRSWRTVEITVDADGLLVRAQERSDDELEAFDRALDAIERQLARFRERVRDSHRRPKEVSSAPEASPTVASSEEATVRILRTKTVALKPMTAEEAIMQMDLLGHDFFLYLDAETDKVAVVYRREEGGYGVLLGE